MKKLISLALALMLVLSLSTVAFADETTGEAASTSVTYTPTAEFTFNEIEKTYTSEDGVVVNETLSFTSTANTSNPDGGKANLTVADLAVSSLNPGTIAVTVPSLSLAGTYEWTIEETAGNTAGVTYDSSEIHVLVLVEYDNTDNELEIGNTTYYVKMENGTKANTFTNTFASGSFDVAKNVTGNMADKNDKFDITVTLNAPEGEVIGTSIKVGGQVITADQWKDGVYTTTLTLSHADGATTFDDIPVGVTYTVVEDNHSTDGYTYKSGEVATAKEISDDSADSVVILNEKTTTVETGITMDSMPYVLLLAVAAVGLVVMFTKKRMMREF